MSAASKPEQGEKLCRFILDYWDDKGYAPNVREMMRGMDYLTTSAVHYQLTKLRAEGRVIWTDGIARSTRVLNGDMG